MAVGLNRPPLSCGPRSGTMRPMRWRWILCLATAMCAACATLKAPKVPLPERLVVELRPDVPGSATMELVLLPAGTFEMGNTDSGRDVVYSWCSLDCERPRHTVRISRPFYMATTEVTQAQWEAVMGRWPEEPPSETYGKGARHPAYFVSWHDAQAFVAALNRAQRGKLRLPSEAEWEYACRGSADNPHRYAPFYFGDDPQCHMTECAPCELFGKYMVYDCPKERCGCEAAGSRLPNDYGLYDLLGNLCEWCQDTWHDDYAGAPANGAAWEDPAHYARVVRGGYWGYGACACRSAYRAWLPPHRRDIHVGFRIVRDP